jgi:Uma2 family endonuclease
MIGPADARDSVSISPRFTSADLELLPAVDGVRYEIIDGELYVSRQPDWHHQYTCNAIGAKLQNWDGQTTIGVTIPAPGLIFAADDDVAPDLVWISRERLAAVQDEAGHLRAAPELVVEVLSAGATNERRDRELKLTLYSRRGVQEYWIVDWRRQTVEVFRREQAALRLVATLGNEDALTSPLLPGFVSAVADLWPPSL